MVFITYLSDENENVCLQTFLERNPNIESLTIESTDLNNWMIKSIVTLDILCIECCELNNISQMCTLLNILHIKGFYKRLNLYIKSEACDDNIMNEFATLRALEILDLDYFHGNINFKPFPHLKEFRLHSYHTEDVKILAKLFVNIEKIYFVFTHYDYILPFLHHSKKLK